MEVSLELQLSLLPEVAEVLPMPVEAELSPVPLEVELSPVLLLVVVVVVVVVVLVAVPVVAAVANDRTKLQVGQNSREGLLEIAAG